MPPAKAQKATTNTKKPNLKAVDDVPEDGVAESGAGTSGSEVDSPPQPEEDLAEILFKGIKFVVPRNRDEWSTEALAYLAEEKYNLFAKYTLEIARQGQWQTVTTLCPRRKDFADFFVKFGDVIREECYG